MTRPLRSWGLWRSSGALSEVSVLSRTLLILAKAIFDADGLTHLLTVFTLIYSKKVGQMGFVDEIRQCLWAIMHPVDYRGEEMSACPTFISRLKLSGLTGRRAVGGCCMCIGNA